MNVLTHAVLNLITHPEQRDRVLSGQVSWEAVMEETLRVQSPVAQLPFRYAVQTSRSAVSRYARANRSS